MSKQAHYFRITKEPADGKYYRKSERYGERSQSVNNHLNKLKNSFRTEDVNTHTEKITLNVKQNKILNTHTRT